MTNGYARAFALVSAILAMGTVTVVMGQSAQNTRQAPLFTAQQAAQGKTLYATHCAACHGDKLQGRAAPALAGAGFAARWGQAGERATSQLTVDDVDYIVRMTMPLHAPGSLSSGDYSALVAFLLQQNGYKAGSTPLRAGSPQLKQARLHFVMAPLVYDHLVVIGVAGGENGASCWVGAFRLSDGSTVWKFHTVPGATLTGSKSWGNPAGIKPGGGAVWTPLTLAPATGRLFVPVANPAPDFAANLRPGSNLYTNSVVALDVHTGKLLWYKQMVPNDSHDYDLTQVGPLFQEKVDGQEVPLMATAGKDGFLKTIDRENHKVIYSTPVTTIKNANMPLTAKGVTACPAVLGGVEWNGPALDRQTNTLFVNAVDWCGDYTSAKSSRFIPGFGYIGGSVTMAKESQGWLTAIDASTGAVRWKYHSTRPMVAAVTATKGGVVFTGDLNGNFLALNANDGKVLYRFNTGGAIGGGVVTYEQGGRQYVAVMTGNPSPFWVSNIDGAPTVFLFALPSGK